MKLREIEHQLQQWKIMVHRLKQFKPGQSHKLNWEDNLGTQCSMSFNIVDSLEDLIKQIKWQLSIRDIDTLSEADLIINYK